MRNFIASLLRYRPLMVVLLLAWIAGGIAFFLQLDIEAYPDPSPPLVEVITQNPSWSAEEMERQVTVPIETVLFGIPHLQYVRSITIFGLSDVKLYFSYDSDYFWDRQEALNRLQLVTLPANLSPQLSPWSPVGEIYRYRLVGPEYTLNELKATEDWFVEREIKQVSGIIDVTSFGGSTREYIAEVDPQKLLQYNVTLPQVVSAVQSSNANVGGNYLTMGEQSINIRGLGLLRSIPEMQNILIVERNGVPVYLRDVADVREGSRPRLGQVGLNHDDDAIEGIVLLQRGEKSLPALRQLEQKIKYLNSGRLPHGMKLVTLYDRTDLIHLTTNTVRHVVIMGLTLVTLILIIFLGDIPISLIAALTIPCSLLFAFAVMVLTGGSANLISIGAIDFGILVGALLFAILLAPVLASWTRPEKVRGHHTRLVRWLGTHYASSLKWTLKHRKTTLLIACCALVATLALGSLLGGEFMPKLEEGNLWVRATLPQDVSYESSAKMAHDIREILLSYPVVTQVVSQMGRPDDGTDVTTFNNIEFMVSLKHPSDWPGGLTKEGLIHNMDAQLEKFPGIDFNFSQ